MIFSILKFFLSLRVLLTIAIIYFFFGGPARTIFYDIIGVEQTGEQGIESGVTSTTSKISEKAKSVISEEVGSGVVEGVESVLINIKDGIMGFFSGDSSEPSEPVEE